ncbi:hypothetical protein EV1_023381 [Malus domestica]
MSWFIRNVFLLIIIVSLFLTMCDAVRVRMHNDIGPDIPLTVHCKSKNDDLGTHVVPFKGSYDFSFGLHLLGRTQFWCRFEWLAVFRYFDIYIQDRDEGGCDECTWRIVPTGPCRLNPEYNSYNICYYWNKDVPTAFAP